MLDYKNVVTSFIASNGNILLLKRSLKVGTNRGKWAAISGYLEKNESPLNRAKVEIEEEVGLEPDQICLVRSGHL
jgi:ADP-ribose pyrophosphatase YjhB (NUDIX family)